MRPSKINLDSPSDDSFIWQKLFSFLSLIAADIGFSFGMILQPAASYKSHDVILKSFKFSMMFSMMGMAMTDYVPVENIPEGFRYGFWRCRNAEGSGFDFDIGF